MSQSLVVAPHYMETESPSLLDVTITVSGQSDIMPQRQFLVMCLRSCKAQLAALDNARSLVVRDIQQIQERIGEMDKGVCNGG